MKAENDVLQVWQGKSDFTMALGAFEITIPLCVIGLSLSLQ